LIKDYSNIFSIYYFGLHFTQFSHNIKSKFNKLTDSPSSYQEFSDYIKIELFEYLERNKYNFSSEIRRCSYFEISRIAKSINSALQAIYAKIEVTKITKELAQEVIDIAS
jgi:hypothetical protein